MVGEVAGVGWVAARVREKMSRRRAEMAAVARSVWLE